eukprot:2084500-Pyramimonas_sp.AAC.1
MSKRRPPTRKPECRANSVSNSSIQPAASAEPPTVASHGPWALLSQLEMWGLRTRRSKTEITPRSAIGRLPPSGFGNKAIRENSCWKRQGALLLDRVQKFDQSACLTRRGSNKSMPWPLLSGMEVSA